MAWHNLKFDVVIKGNDWKGKAKWVKYEKEFSELNVDVVYFEYTKGTSSTQLREVLEKYLKNQSVIQNSE